MSIIGYGVDTKDLNRYDILSFFMKHDSKERIGDMILDILSKRKDKDDLTRTEIDRLADNICEWIKDHDGTVADYIAGIINREEKAAGHIHEQNVVTVYDSYIVFNAILSPEDRKKRLKWIRTKEDFVSMLKGYLPYSGLVFGTIYDGYKTILTHWIEPDKP